MPISSMAHEFLKFIPRGLIFAKSKKIREIAKFYPRKVFFDSFDPQYGYKRYAYKKNECNRKACYNLILIVSKGVGEK